MDTALAEQEGEQHVEEGTGWEQRRGEGVTECVVVYVRVVGDRGVGPAS